MLNRPDPFHIARGPLFVMGGRSYFAELLRTPFSGTSPYSSSVHPVNKGFSLASIADERLMMKKRGLPSKAS